MAFDFDRKHPRTAVAVRAAVTVWLIVLTVILLADGLWIVALVTAAGAAANAALGYMAWRPKGT